MIQSSFLTPLISEEFNLIITFVCPARKPLFLFLTLFSFLLTTPSHGETNLKIPAEYGEVIYQCNEKSPNQLFIIGMSHRDSLTRANGQNTSRVQAEVYQIGDWLIHNRQLELLLPEGFFKDKKAKTEKKNVIAAEGKNKCFGSSDIKVLEEKLSDSTTYVNAEMLLKEDHILELQQVEDKGLYDAVSHAIFRLATCDSDNYSVARSELDYLQEKRTAAMLQKIPEIVEDEFGQGNIKSRKAIFTIGMSHLHKIITYLNENRITIYAPLLGSDGNKDYIAELNLQKENFGLSVILPRTLADDQKTLEMNRLDRIVRGYQRNPLPLH